MTAVRWLVITVYSCAALMPLLWLGDHIGQRSSRQHQHDGEVRACLRGDQ